MRVLMGGTQFSVNCSSFSAKYQLTTIFVGQFSVNYWFWLAINFHFPTAIIISS